MPDLSPQVRLFIDDFISSVAQLEVILFLHCSPERWWSAEALSQELRQDPTWLGRLLLELVSIGIVETMSDPSPVFRFRAKTEELNRTIATLAQEYIVHRVRMIEMIYSKPSKAIRAFADAFDLRKRNPNG